MNQFKILAAVVAVVMLFGGAVPMATAYEVAYLDGGHWNTVYVQGFSTSLGATPDPGLSNGDPVFLSKFEFFKSGNADAASGIQLAILNNIFVDMSGGLDTGNAAFVGLSTNTIADTTGIATGDPIAFDFDDLPLAYDNNYAAVFVNVSGSTLTPVLVSALDANYVDVGGGDFHPETNYGAEDQFIYATSNFISGSGFFSTFSYAGDANFRATIRVPEPGSIFLVICGVALSVGVWRRRQR